MGENCQLWSLALASGSGLALRSAAGGWWRGGKWGEKLAPRLPPQNRPLSLFLWRLILIPFYVAHHEEAFCEAQKTRQTIGPPQVGQIKLSLRIL